MRHIQLIEVLPRRVEDFLSSILLVIGELAEHDLQVFGDNTSAISRSTAVVVILNFSFCLEKPVGGTPYIRFGGRGRYDDRDALYVSP